MRDRLKGIIDNWDKTDPLADHLLKNGVIHLPCKIGDTVYAIRNYQGEKHPQKGVVSEMYFLPDMTLHIVVRHISRGEWGKEIFPTKEAAEKALRGEGE